MYSLIKALHKMPPQDSITIETCVEGAWVWYSGESVSFGVTNPGLPLTRLLSLGKLRAIFEPLFPQLWKGGKTSLWHFFVRSENITQVAGRYYYPYCHHYYHNHKYMDDCNTELINGIAWNVPGTRSLVFWGTRALEVLCARLLTILAHSGLDDSRARNSGQFCKLHWVP